MQGVGVIKLCSEPSARGFVKQGNTLSRGKSWRPRDYEAREEARQRLSADIIRAGQADKAAMERVYRQTSAKIYALLLRMLPDPAAAEEVLQETYLAIWRRANTFSLGRTSPMSWLITVARNKAIDRLRNDRFAGRSTALDDLAAEPQDPEPNALARLEADAEQQKLHHCLEQLENHQRDAIRTAFFAGMTYDELARLNGVPLGTMKSWIRRGLMRLRTCLET